MKPYCPTCGFAVLIHTKTHAHCALCETITPLSQPPTPPKWPAVAAILVASALLLAVLAFALVLMMV